MKIEIMDTTLRDGEQTSGVAFTSSEKLSIAKMLLEDVNVDRIEIASARISKGEMEAVEKIITWAKKSGYLDRVEVLGFVDGKKSIDWIDNAGGKVLNLLCKGSLKHVECQLKKKPAEHIKDIEKSFDYAKSKGMSVNVYLEDWSNGMRNSKEYVFLLVDSISKMGVARVMLPDTLGIFGPFETCDNVKELVTKYPKIHFDFHSHNDYGLAVSNAMAAIKAGAKGVHTTVNGLGERAGNAPLASVVAIIKDQLGKKTIVKESRLSKISTLVEAFSGIRIPGNEPVIGEHVFTQVCGVHADGDSKGNLYFNDLIPERFGRERKYALGKTSGKASIKKNLEEFGIELDKESMQKVTARVVEISDKKEKVTAEDLPYIISDVLGSDITKNKVKVSNYFISHAYGLQPTANVTLEVDGKIYEESAKGDGQYDAFMKAIVKISKKIKFKMPQLVDYVVTIPPGGKTDALVETMITWRNGKEFKTRGLDSDQTAAAIKATIRMMNLIIK